MAGPNGKKAGFRSVVAGAALLLALLVAYSPSLRFSRFVFDAVPVVERNPVVTGPFSFQKLFTTDYWGRPPEATIGSYRPFAVFETWLEYRLFGPRPDRFAVTQILWMFGVCLAALTLLRRIGLAPPTAWLAALVFAVHPAHAGIVANMAGRADLIMALLFLLALVLHRRQSLPWRIATLALVALGLLTKELFAVFPVAALIVDGLGPAPVRLRWRSYLLYAALAGLFVLLRHQVIGTASFPHGPHDNPLLAEPLSIRLLNQPMILWRYFEMLALPVSLSPDYTYNAVPVLHSPWDGRFFAGLVLIAALAWACWSARRRPAARVLFALAALFYLPLSNVAFPGPLMLADRWLFLVSLPFSAAVAAAFTAVAARLPRLRVPVFGAGIVCAGALLVAAFDYAGHFGSMRALAEYACAHAPGSVKAHLLLGRELLEEGDQAAALREFEAALDIEPGDAGALVGQADAYERMGQEARAESLLRRAAEQEGEGRVGARVALSLFLGRHQRLGEAAAVDRLVAAQVGQAIPAALLGPIHDYAMALAEAGRFGEARPYLAALRDIEPDDPAVGFQLGQALARTGRFRESLPLLLRALEREPDAAEIHNSVGIVYASLGQMNEAVGHFEEAARLAPHVEGVLRNLEMARRKLSGGAPVR